MSLKQRADIMLHFIQSLRIRSRDLQIIPLRLNHAQRMLWARIEDRLNKRQKVWMIVLKARREGVSTFLESLMLTRTILDDYVHSLVMASNAGNTAEIWRMASTMVDNSPWKKYADKKNKEIHIGKSKLIVATAGSADATRGFDLTCLHLSEVAFWENANTMLAAMQCLPDQLDTFCFIESTANGKTGQGEQFYDTWCRATSGESEFIPIFLPWFEMPEYCRPGYVYKDAYVQGSDQAQIVLEDLDDEEKELSKEFKLTAGQLAWRRWAIPNKCEGDLDKFNQEYPATADSAFVQSGNPMFRNADLIPFMRDVRRGEKFDLQGGRFKFNPQGILEIWKHPEPGHQYVIGADTSMGYDEGTGREQRSRSSACILDMATLEQCAEYDASTPPHIQARHLAIMGSKYNNALLAPEVTSSGGGGGRELIVYLKELNYWNIHIWRHADRIRREQGHLYGWECLDPDAKVLTGDLRWVSARQLKVGTQLAGCQEYPSGGKGSSNRLRMQTLTGHTLFAAPRIRLTLVNGQQTTVSTTHPFWVCREPHTEWSWRLAQDIQPGDYVRYLPMWDELRTYDAGRLSGFIDGEGHLAQGKQYGFQLLVSQVEGPTAQEIRDLWVTNDFASTFKWLRHKKRPHEKPVATCGVTRTTEVLRALGSLRPLRLLRRFAELEFGRLTLRSFDKIAVSCIETLDEGPVVGLTTEPDHTLIADGIVGHNTNSRTRPMMIARIREYINERCGTLHSASLIKQLANFGENESGRTEALTGHDDLLFAFGIALCSRRENYYPPLPGKPQEPRNVFDPSAYGFPMHAYAADHGLAAHWEKLQKPLRNGPEKDYMEL